MRWFAFSDSTRLEGEPLLLGWKHMFQTLWYGTWPLMKLNLCFLLFCLPIVTIPAAITALHAGCVDLVQGKRVDAWKCLQYTIKTQWLHAWVLLAMNFIPLLIALYGAYFYMCRLEKLQLLAIPGILLAGVAVVAYLMLPYSFTMLARLDLSLPQIIKNAFCLVFLNLKFSICCGTILLFLTILCVLFWIYVLPLLLLIIFSLLIYLTTYFSLFALQKYVLTEEL